MSHQHGPAAKADSHSLAVGAGSGSAPLPLLSAFKTTSGVLFSVLVSPVQESLTYWSRSSGGPPSWSGVGAHDIGKEVERSGFALLDKLIAVYLMKGKRGVTTLHREGQR